MVVVIVSKLGRPEEGTPVGLVIPNKVAEALFDCLIGNFGLSIGPWVEGCGGVELDAEVLVEFFGELQNEDASFVGNNCLWCPM